MSGQIQQAREANAEVYWSLRGTREGGHGCISVGATTEFIRCACVPCLHASKGLLLIQMGPSRRDKHVSWIAGIRFCVARP